MRGDNQKCESNFDSRTSKERLFIFYVPDSKDLCKICGSHGGDYEECHLLRCYIVWLL
jgi:hypothetical protein